MILPEHFWFNGVTPVGHARSETGAKQIVRLTFKQTIFFDVKDEF